MLTWDVYLSRLDVARQWNCSFSWKPLLMLTPCLLSQSRLPYFTLLPEAATTARQGAPILPSAFPYPLITPNTAEQPGSQVKLQDEHPTRNKTLPLEPST